MSGAEEADRFFRNLPPMFRRYKLTYAESVPKEWKITDDVVFNSISHLRECVKEIQ